MKETKEKKKTRLFGRNLFTLLFIIVSVTLLFFIIYIPTSYATTWNNNVVQPFTGSAPVKIPGVDAVGTESAAASYDENTTHIKYIKQSELEEFDLNFYCQEYTEANSSAKFNFSATPNEKTQDLYKKYKLNSFTVNACLNANWVKFCIYSATYSGGSGNTLTYTFNTEYIKDEEGKNTSEKQLTKKETSIYFTSLIDFPAKSDGGFPAPVTVDSADCDLYISYKITENGKEHTYIYIIHYTYSEYMVSGVTIGSR